MVVAMHQPTFLPWLGWWDKLVRADVFVLLDDVQFPKKGGAWMNRTRILVGGEPKWITVPIQRAYHGVRSVRETMIDDSKPWRKKLVATLATSYGRAPHFDDVYPAIEDVISLRVHHVAELNEAGIRRLATGLGVETDKIVRQSELGVDGAATDLLVNLCKAVSGTTYMTGDGAGEYLEPEKFVASGLAVVEQCFSSPQYPQLTDQYVAGLSVVDALMNCGWEGTTGLVVR